MRPNSWNKHYRILVDGLNVARLYVTIWCSAVPVKKNKQTIYGLEFNYGYEKIT